MNKRSRIVATGDAANDLVHKLIGTGICIRCGQPIHGVMGLSATICPQCGQDEKEIEPMKMFHDKTEVGAVNELISLRKAASRLDAIVKMAVIRTGATSEETLLDKIDELMEKSH